MLNQLKSILENDLGSQELAINTVPSSCCTSTKKVYDFDKVKDTFTSKLGIGSLCSCDCLLLDFAKDAVYLIEMKDVEKLIASEKPNFNTVDDFQEHLKRRFQNFRLDDKIIDSFVLLISIWSYFSKLGNSFYAYMLNKNKMRVKYIILVNLSSQNYLTYSIETLAIQERYRYRFLTTVTLIRSDDFDNLIK